jgi:hypothetical protein
MIMKPLRILAVLAPLALAACGTQSAEQTLADAAPSFAALSMDQTGADTSPTGTPTGALAVDPSVAAMVAPDAPCHPHLFVRTHEVVERFNRHLYKFLWHVERALANAPKLATASQGVWEHTYPNGVTARLTITQPVTGQFTWLLEVAPKNGSFVTVFSGDIDRTQASGPHQGKGSLKLDLDALHSVLPQEHAVGVIQAGFDVKTGSRYIVVDAAKVAWEINPAMCPRENGAEISSGALAVLSQPRSGHYVYLREAGKGGSLQIKDQMVFFCPANPSYLLADAVVVGRWYRLGDGSLHGRTDGKVTGGQLPSHVPSIDKIVGVTCYQSSTEDRMPGELYWLMKSEDATGATITGAELSLEGGSVSTCDPQLNQGGGLSTDPVVVPKLADDKSDFDFTKIVFGSDVSFTSNPAYPFPGM